MTIIEQSNPRREMPYWIVKGHEVYVRITSFTESGITVGEVVHVLNKEVKIKEYIYGWRIYFAS